jgi:hypothetical protein
LLLAGAALAQVGGGFDLSWNTVDSGGATFSTGGGFSLGGTAGQSDAGVQTGGQFRVDGGFWGVTRLLAVNTATPTPTSTASATGTATATPTGTLTPTSTSTPTPSPTFTPTATPTSVTANVEENEDKGRKLTEEQRRQKERSNAGSESDERVEGNIAAVYCERVPPEIVIANVDGAVTLRLVRGAAALCSSARPGQYLTSDNAEKQNEQLYDVFDFSVGR